MKPAKPVTCGEFKLQLLGAVATSGDLTWVAALSIGASTVRWVTLSEFCPWQTTSFAMSPSKSPASRTFSDYENIPQAMEGVCKMFEQHLKELYPTQAQINYDISDLFAFIDALGDLSCLVFRGDTKQYQPHGKEWIKQKVYESLKKQMV